MGSAATTINIDDILKETESILNEIETDQTMLEKNKVSTILNELIIKIRSVNFREYCKFENDKDKLQKKHYLVGCIEVLLKTAKQEGFNLCRKSELIYLYNSEYWEKIPHEYFKDFLGEVALKMGVDKFDAKHHLFKDELFKQFIADAGLKEIKPNHTTTLINLKNGTFEITPKKQFLREFRSSDFLTYQLPFEFNQNAMAPRFEMFLNEVLPNIELQYILSEYLGNIFIRSNVLKLEKVLLLYGSGANGKSVLFDIIMALLGKENVTNYSLHSLTADNSKSRINIVNKLLNYASEINGKLESDVFKQMVSGEPLEIPVLYQQSIIATDYAKLMFNCNELPREVENTNAYFRRFIILPFLVEIPDEKQDKELSTRIIKNELSGVFNWVLQGLVRLLKNKTYTKSNIVKNEILKYQKESDSVLMFLDEESYKSSISNDRPLKDLYHEYKSFCIENHFGLCSNRTFSQRLRKNGYKIERKSYGNVVFIEKIIINVECVDNVSL